MSTPPPPPPPTNPTPAPTHNVDMKGGNAFKIGCMVALGVFAACFLAFCALPAACTVGVGSLAMVGAASSTPTSVSTSSAVIEPDINTDDQPIAPPLPTITPSTVKVLTPTEATAIYQKAVAEGVVTNYDRATETVYVSDTAWAGHDAAYVNQFVQAVNTLVGHGKAFRIIGNPSQTLIFAFNP